MESFNLGERGQFTQEGSHTWTWSNILSTVREVPPSVDQRPQHGAPPLSGSSPRVLPQPRCLPRGPSFRHWPPPAGIGKGARPRAQLDLSSEKSPPSHRLKPPNPHLNSDRILAELSRFPACLLCLPPHLLPGRGPDAKRSLSLAGNQPDCHSSLPKPGLGADERGLGMGCGEE